jgi:hypothetical protein
MFKSDVAALTSRAKDRLEANLINSEEIHIRTQKIQLGC